MDFKKTLVAAGLAISAASVHAIPIESGTIEFTNAGNSYAAIDFVADTVAFTASTQAGTAGNDGEVNVVEGDFASYLSVGDFADFSDFSYDAANLPELIWTAGGLTFTLEAIATVSEFTAGFVKGLFIEGGGSVSDGVDTTYGSWGIGLTGNGTKFTWTSTNVPEPATIALFGLGLAGLGMARRKQSKA